MVSSSSENTAAAVAIAAGVGRTKIAASNTVCSVLIPQHKYQHRRDQQRHTHEYRLSSA